MEIAYKATNRFGMKNPKFGLHMLSFALLGHQNESIYKYD